MSQMDAWTSREEGAPTVVQLAVRKRLQSKDVDRHTVVKNCLVSGTIGADLQVHCHFPKEGEVVDGASVDLSAVLPDAQTYFQYSGSLTTPPCSEGVAWQVLETPIEISQAQLDAFTAVVDGNFRPVQPLGERLLVLDSASGS